MFNIGWTNVLKRRVRPQTWGLLVCLVHTISTIFDLKQLQKFKRVINLWVEESFKLMKVLK